MNNILARDTALKAGRRLNKVGKYYDLQPWMSQIKRARVQRAKDERTHHTAEKCRHCGLTLSSVLPQCGLFFRWRGLRLVDVNGRRKEAVSSVVRSMWRPIQTFAFFADKAPIRKP